MPSIIISERVRRAGIELSQIDAHAAFVVGALRRHRAGIDVELRDGAEQIRRGERARHRKILRGQIDHRHADRRGAADQRAGDQHRLGNFLRLGHHLGGINAFRLGHRQKRGRSQQRQSRAMSLENSSKFPPRADRSARCCCGAELQMRQITLRLIFS